MKGETSADGKMSGNVQLVRAHNAHKAGGKGKGGMMPEGQSGEETGPDHSEVDNVVAEHGPAMSHTITDNGDGTHSSQTTHADGHVHEKHGHKSLKEAHEHGEHAMDQSPDQQTGADEEKPMGMGKVSHTGAGGY